MWNNYNSEEPEFKRRFVHHKAMLCANLKLLEKLKIPEKKKKGQSIIQ
jgi:hypothetical protein